MKKRELLNFVNASQNKIKEKYKGRKYITREEAEDDLKEIARVAEFNIEEIKTHSTNTYDENRKVYDDIWNAYLDAYKRVKVLFKAPDKKAQKKIRKNEAKLAALQKKIAKMEKDFEDRFSFPPPR